MVPVSTLVHYLKEAMEGNPVLHGILVEGEISNLRIPSSGHWYFSLKDERASISCVMFASAARRLNFRAKNGDKVILTGDISVYEAGGTMQIIAQSMQPSGIGDLYLQLEALKKKLLTEGIFAPEHKQSLPKYPMDIALITGNQTAGRQDVLITLHKRWPIAKIHEYTCPVQGAEAAAKITEALVKADNGGHDVILLVRGGGSFEDLWCFNDETLARAIYHAKTPIITGIGHETDFTIADYAADVRANTPTGAVETAVPDQREILQMLSQYQIRLTAKVMNQLSEERSQWTHLRQSTVFTRPERMYSEQTSSLDYLEERLMRYVNVPRNQRAELHSLSHQFYACIQNRNQKLKQEIQDSKAKMMLSMKQNAADQNAKLHTSQSNLQQQMTAVMDHRTHTLEVNMKLLDAYSPLKVMERGYSITTKDQNVVNSIDDVNLNDLISIRVKDGSIHASVMNKESEHGKNKNDI